MSSPEHPDLRFATATASPMGGSGADEDPWSRTLRRAIFLAITLHVTAALAALFGPLLFQHDKPPMRYVSVQVVPLQALGKETPRETPRQRQEELPPPPPPAPPPPETRPEEPPPPPPDPELPTLPPDKPERKPKPEPVPVAPPPEPIKPQPVEPERVPIAPPQGSERGTARGTAAFGATIEGLDPDFTYGYYIDRLLALIHAQWTRPPVPPEVEGVVFFRILRDGRVEALEVMTSSGYESFDRSALRAVTNAAPLPPLPAGYRRDALKVRLTFR